ncbi:MAG: hypothetical protein ABIR17_06930 [Pseudolysinimonas sp.]|uniref:hypothetical protein n=1 Tax=Pseudolysinimonas sp. TaxID=2680009 RepID=UPI003263D018
MESTKTGNRGPRIALGAAFIVAFLTLAGCSTAAPSPSPTQTSASPYTIDDTTGGFAYTDALSGYAVTFPQQPDVEPLANNETDQPAYYASAELASGEFASTGQILNHTPNLQAQVMGMASSMNPSGQVSASSYTLGGLDAAHAEFTAGSSSSIPSDLVGQPSEIVVAGDGNHFYALIALGGTSDERQAFFDSFKRIDG